MMESSRKLKWACEGGGGSGASTHANTHGRNRLNIKSSGFEVRLTAAQSNQIK